MKCPSCNYEKDSITSISLHYRHNHGPAKEFQEKLKQRFIDEKYAGVEPKCLCGCGNVPKFNNINVGYSSYCPGHQARVNNNWGHNDAALKKSQGARREQIAAGEWSPWNKGETKETDDRIAAYGETQSSNFTPERRKVRSIRMTQNRLNKTVPDIKGKQHGRWKGGVSSVQQLARSYVFNVWTYPKLKAGNFTCASCSSKENLCVHHNVERFSDILQKARGVLGDTDDTFEKVQAYAEWVANYHVLNDVSGIVLCEDCHAIEHSN